LQTKVYSIVGGWRFNMAIIIGVWFAVLVFSTIYGVINTTRELY